MSEPKRVLVINIDGTVFGGVESFLMSVYRNIDRSKIQFDFLAPTKEAYKDQRAEIKKLGGKNYNLGVKWKESLKNKLEYGKRLEEFLTEHNYEIVHINSGSFSFNLQVAAVANKCGVKRIISHSHSGGVNDGKRIKLFVINKMKYFLEQFATDYLACSDIAAESLFSDELIKSGEVKIINNGIDVKKFEFNESARKKIRRELDIEDNIVYGNVGRFDTQKNHKFLIEIFTEILKKQENARLVLVGDGVLKKDVEEQVKKLGIEEKVVFVGRQSDVAPYYSAFDVLIMPSLYEGFPVAMVEAAASNLKMYCSNTITRSVKEIADVEFLSLTKSAEKWADEICRGKNLTVDKRKVKNDKLFKKKYDISDTAKIMENIYCDNRRKK